MLTKAATFVTVVVGVAAVALTGASLAQNATPSAATPAATPAAKPATSSGIQLITLGTTAGPLPRKDRAQSSNVLIVNGTPYLIDAGDGVARRLVQAGVDFTKIGRVFITHNHGDHTMGVPNLLSVEWQYNRREPIVFYGPPGTEEMVKAALVFDDVDAAIRLSETQVTPIEKIVVAHNVGTGQIYEDGNVKVTAVENTHFQFKPGSPAYGKFKSYGYRFQIGDKAVVFTGDTGPSEAVTNLAKGRGYSGGRGALTGRNQGAAGEGRPVAEDERAGAFRVVHAHEPGTSDARGCRQDGCRRRRQNACHESSVGVRRGQ